MSIDTLVAEYPGDRAWGRFVATFPEPLAGADEAIGDQSLARVLVAELGDQAARWMAQPVRILEDRSPAQVLATHPQGLLAVRSAVMRIPR